MPTLNINDVKSSLSFLMSSMVDSGRQAMREMFGMPKSTWLSQTERFESFFSQLSADDSAVDNFKEKFIVPLYKKHEIDFTAPIINSSDVIQDDFMKIKDDETQLKLRKDPRGLFLHSNDGAALKSLYLPVSEAYTSAVEASIKNKQRNVMLPVKILLGFYSTLFYSLKDLPEHATHSDLEAIRSNIKVLNEYMESLDTKDEPESQDEGPMGLIKGLLGNINFDQIGDMMNKVTNDEQASEEFKSVFDRMTQGIQGGKAPMDVMGQIIKEATEKSEQPEEETALLPGLARLGEQPSIEEEK
tara:strand:- start:199 stop:1101 length:903 start_codon:yes stop_codon:yes gene_type:complete